MVEYRKINPPVRVCKGRVFQSWGLRGSRGSLQGDVGLHPSASIPYSVYSELADNLKADMSFSNRSFDVDERSQKKIDLYNKVQSEKRELRQDKKQYEDYKLTLGNNAPKSFSGFRRMKQSNSQNWQDLQEEYKTARAALKE